ncbi:MAG TPA: 2-C-methyl-D-erythritol 2,4-cyclodiphosphate synthase [bacterium]
MIRVGFGYDVHQLVEGRALILGGVEVPFEKGLLGHSDADVLCHAIGDALLGGAALGDLGFHFPNSDPKFAGISSLWLLQEIARMLRESNFEINNVDSTVVLEKPKLLPYIPAMLRNIAASLRVSESQISIKATTSERLGFVGRGQGVQAFASALLQQLEQPR